MPVVDFHAHITPERYKSAIKSKGEWHGLGPAVGKLHYSGFRLSVDERLEQMKSLGVDFQVLSPTVGFFQYGNELSVTKAVARESNDEIAEHVGNHPDKFAGLGTIPMQDMSAAIAEMQRVMVDLRFVGVEIGDHVNGRTYDDPHFVPFFREAEALGAMLFFHQDNPTVVATRTEKYELDNSIGNLTDRAITYGTLVYGGVIDRFPGLKLLLAHAGGYTPYAVGRMDKASGFMEPDQQSRAAESDFGGFVSPLDLGPHPNKVRRAPSSYLRAFYYDCCTFTGSTLRFLVDTVGADRVVLGTDYPAPMVLADAVRWVSSLPNLTADERNSILSGAAAALLAR